jgi:glycosyltransferase involved in cell wall biosynthesis
MRRETGLKSKLAFIDHSFHQKSEATRFLIDLLKKHYDVTIFWDEAWNGGPKIDIKDFAGKNYNTIVIFQQTHFSEKELESIADQNPTLIPMFDDSREFPDTFWGKFRHVKIINFSNRFHLRMQKLGLNSRYFQYFPSPDARPGKKTKGTGLTGLFWQRTDKITWNHIRELIKNTNFKKIHIHAAVDPPENYPLILPSEEEKNIYNISVSEWFPDKKEYYKILNEAAVFFAPRLHEGIGMSFLEAMRLGKCVVVPDNPTMNEYIVHGKTGLIYNPENLGPLDFSRVDEIGRKAWKYIENGYIQWKISEKEIIGFIRQPVEKIGYFKKLWFKIYFRVKIILLKLS